MNRKNGIVIAGNILADIVNIIDRYPQKSMLANILSSEPAVGGCVPNTIIDIAKLDPEVPLSAVGCIGNDENGRYLLSQMEKYGVNTELITVLDDAATAADYVMTDKVDNSRTFFYTGGANKLFDESHIDISRLNCKIFHIGYLLLLDALDAPDSEYGTKMARLLHNVQKQGIKTSIDAVSAEAGRFSAVILPALKYCDYVIINEIEICSATGLAPRNDDGSLNVGNIKSSMQKFFGYGVREKVIVHCTEAGFLLDNEGNFTEVGSLILPKGYVKGSVGAGDAFAAGCLYGIYNDYENEKILEFASCAAAMSLSEADSISGMKPKSEVEKLGEIYPRRKR